MPTKSGVFVSYSRTDGSEYATWLREKLQKQHREIPLWQDIISERAGRDWWQQITHALDHVACMVVVATPHCLKSDTVRKEWRYARQQGVYVLPVQAAAGLDFGSLPRWMQTKHFADLKIKAQWDLFLSDLHRPPETARVPFMAEDKPPDFVARPDQFEPLIRLLLDTSREREKNPVAITTALQGAGGFGKTTLAKAICHDERIQEAFDDGTLWVTLGEDLSRDRLKGKVKDLIAVLSGEDTDFDSMEAAGSRLRELLADRSILMVIDDVWNPADLNPFLQGGKFCARLITTRHLDTLPRQCRDVKVDSMQPDEAADLLGKGLPPDCKSQLDPLAKRVGYWPLLLGIVNGHLRERVDRTSQPLSQAIAYVSRALHEGGLTALDPENAAARNLAVALTVDVSLQHFSHDERDRRRFEELSIFPEDVDIPLSVVEKLWSATGNLKPYKVEDLCVKLNRHSLLQTLNLETRHLRLHDVMRTYLQTTLAARTDPKLVHASLVDPWGDAHKLTDSYAWRWYAYHSAQAGGLRELRGLLLDPVWLQAKLAATDITSLTSDFDHLPGDEDSGLVQGAIRLSAHVLARDPQQFSSQIIGRLLTYADRPEIKHFSDGVAEAAAETSWLRPLQLALDPPGTALVRVLAGHTGSVTAVAVTAGGKLAVSASFDQTLKVWELESGRQLRTLRGHRSGVCAVSVMGDGKLAVSASDDQTLKVWELESGVLLATFTCDGAARCCVFAGARNLIVAGDAGGHVHFLRLEQPKASPEGGAKR